MFSYSNVLLDSPPDWEFGILVWGDLDVFLRCVNLVLWEFRFCVFQFRLVLGTRPEILSFFSLFSISNQGFCFLNRSVGIHRSAIIFPISSGSLPNLTQVNPTVTYSLLVLYLFLFSKFIGFMVIK